MVSVVRNGDDSLHYTPDELSPEPDKHPVKITEGAGERHEFEVAKIVFSLTTAGLMHEVVNAKALSRENVDEAFFEQLTFLFTEVMGPLAPMIIEDEIRLLGEVKGAFPQDKAAELVERISLEISDGAKRAQFQKQMVSVLRG